MTPTSLGVDDMDTAITAHDKPMIAMTHAWQSALDRGGAVGALFVDFRNAFDLVNHNGIAT